MGVDKHISGVHGYRMGWTAALARGCSCRKPRHASGARVHCERIWTIAFIRADVRGRRRLCRGFPVDACIRFRALEIADGIVLADELCKLCHWGSFDSLNS